jgi:DNA-binding NarL/FixJ family response regulator
MARVVAYIPDLLFGSQVQGALRAAGHDVELAANASGVNGKLAGADVLICDLTDDVSGRIGVFETLKAATTRVRSLAFYSHVETQTRAAAQAVGFDLVVPRSRMAREAGALIDELIRRSRSRTER